MYFGCAASVNGTPYTAHATIALARAVAPSPPVRVLAERGEPNLIRIAARKRHGAREDRLEEARGIPGDDDPVEMLGGDLVGEHLVQLGHHAKLPHDLHLRQVRHVAGDELEVHAVAVIAAGPALVDSDYHLALRGRVAW